jgi:hypothetical protein
LGAARELVAVNWAAILRRGEHERFHRKREPLRLCVGAEHFDLHNLSGLDRFGGILNEAVREFADVYWCNDLKRNVAENKHRRPL